MKWYVYLVRGRDNSLYTGITTNIPRRVLQHNSGMGAKSLLGKLPVRLVYKEEFPDQKSAAKREREIKGWKREKKEKIIMVSHDRINRRMDHYNEGFTLRTKGS